MHFSPCGSRRRFLTRSAAACLMPWPVRAAQSSAVRDVDWLAEVQQPPAVLLNSALKLRPILVDGHGHTITAWDAWKQRRDQLRRWWLDFLGPLATQHRNLPDYEVIAEDRPEGVLRQLVRYEVEPGWPVEAYVLKPLSIGRLCPGVVCCHSTVRHTIRQPAGVEGKPEKAFGLKMARRGYVAICPRCFLWSNDLSISYEQHVARFHARHPQSKGMAKMLYDTMIAVDILAAMPAVDASRICAVGHSLGGKEVLYLAAFDERIRATVSSEGGGGTSFSNWDASWYLGSSIHTGSFDHEHNERLALWPPRPFLLLGRGSA